MTVVANCIHDPSANGDGERDKEDRHHETPERVGGYDQRGYG